MKLRIPHLSAIATLTCAVLATSFASSANAADPDGNWMVRLRGTYLNFDNKSDPIGGSGASDRISVNDKWIPEVDVSYFFTPNIAAELVLTYPQKQDVKLDGNTIGSFKHLPPTLMAQYHFILPGQASALKPYVGAGINFTRIMSVDILDKALTLDKWSVGPALQVGADYRLTKNWYINADVKYVWMESDVKQDGTKISKVTLDPWLLSLGVGYRF